MEYSKGKAKLLIRIIPIFMMGNGRTEQGMEREKKKQRKATILELSPTTKGTARVP